jgi:preprotein translocase subunit YajC
MNFTPAVLLLQAGDPPAQSPFGSLPLIPMAAIFLIFYFLLIRPQQKQRKEQEAMIKAIVKGDDVVTSGGLHGKVTGVADDVLTVEIAVVKGDRIRVKVARNRIESVKKGDGAKKKDAGS